MVTRVYLFLVYLALTACGTEPIPSNYMGTTRGGMWVYDDLSRDHLLDFAKYTERTVYERSAYRLGKPFNELPFEYYRVWFRNMDTLPGNRLGLLDPNDQVIQIAMPELPTCGGGHGSLGHELLHAVQIYVEEEPDYDHADPYFWEKTGGDHSLEYILRKDQREWIEYCEKEKEEP